MRALAKNRREHVDDLTIEQVDRHRRRESRATIARRLFDERPTRLCSGPLAGGDGRPLAARD
jgi:hypothetical protein